MSLAAEAGRGAKEQDSVDHGRVTFSQVVAVVTIAVLILGVLVAIVACKDRTRVQIDGCSRLAICLRHVVNIVRLRHKLACYQRPCGNAKTAQANILRIQTGS